MDTPESPATNHTPITGPTTNITSIVITVYRIMTADDKKPTTPDTAGNKDAAKKPDNKPPPKPK